MCVLFFVFQFIDVCASSDIVVCYHLDVHQVDLTVLIYRYSDFRFAPIGVSTIPTIISAVASKLNYTINLASGRDFLLIIPAWVCKNFVEIYK